MLEELRIRNFAIIDTLELELAPGLNVITGETGAGKSILIDAVELLLGGKSDATSLRAGADRALIEGSFRLDERAAALVTPILLEADLASDDPTLLTLARDLRGNGRTSARVNGVTVNAETLRALGETLIDIHGQSEYLSLFNPRSHLNLLDSFGGLREIRASLAEVVSTLGDVRRRIGGLEQDRDALERRAEMLRYEIEEIRAAELEPDEEVALAAERSRLANSQQLALLSGEAQTLLADDEATGRVGLVEGLQEVAAALLKLVAIDPALASEHEIAEEMAANAQELALTLAHYGEEIEHDPDRVDAIEERLELIRKLKRRLKVDTVAGLIDYANAAEIELEAIDNSESRLEKLREQEERLLHHVGQLAFRLSKARVVAGEELARQVVAELADLRMPDTRFAIETTMVEAADGCPIGEKRYAFGPDGVDRLEFMMSANPGQPLRPLVKVASGGEAARIMLALKRVLTAADQTPTLIFDEVDQGIGGRVGAVIGEKLWALTGEHQVLVVTHLPQLASYADRHYKVEKVVRMGNTTTEVHVLDDAGRAGELAEMLGARGEAGHQSARDLLDAAAHHKQLSRTIARATEQE
jgi:DNA repair protein RecN (Recombination protein N)